MAWSSGGKGGGPWFLDGMDWRPRSLFCSDWDVLIFPGSDAGLGQAIRKPIDKRNIQEPRTRHP
ncbi:MAG: hypothetical protein CMH56_11585 [Myxococcales bacterium]|nr:hypothetical protein [Myxococcales bacterium]